jgi:asparagine synthase (glutamine-hydrolysing)
MCGIAGVFELTGVGVPIDVVRGMTTAMIHRGPDDEGQYVDGRVGLGSRRLAIIDLTAAGHQPMANESATTVLVYNGEIYNFRELRAQLKALGFVFRSRSDTEVLLRAYEAWGPNAVQRLNGHFAFALWDRAEQRLILARDRFGVKPLYYWNDGKRIVFGSEIKAILAHPSVSVRVCEPALREYFTFQNILSDRTLFDRVRMLPPASTMEIDARTGTISQQVYWDYRFRPERMEFGDAVDVVFQSFEAAVSRQLVSDVAVGSYLSGGVDSSSIAALAAAKLGRISTFTCGFDLSSASGLEIAFDERSQAEEMAFRVQSEHYEVVLHAGDMQHIMRPLVWSLEDLRVGQSYPNFAVAKLASRFVKVVLSGIGGDELFGGYPWRYLADDPPAYYRYWQRLVPEENHAGFFTPQTWSRVRDEPLRERFQRILDQAQSDNPLEQAWYLELKTFLPGLLVVEDKLSMAHSLEGRAPFLDNDVVDLALRLESKHKTGDGKTSSDGKLVLREALRRLVPGNVASRPKQGFSAPDASWFRGASIDYMRSRLSKSALLNDFIEPKAVTQVLDQHCNGQHNHRLLIWSLLSFETWCEVFL